MRVRRPQSCDDRSAMHVCPQCEHNVSSIYLHHGKLYCLDCLPVDHRLDAPAMRAHIRHMKERGGRRRAPTLQSPGRPTYGRFPASEEL